MAMRSLSTQECEEILREFRLRCPDFPDQLQQELAFNFGLDAPCDIDFLDVIEIMARPGLFDVITGEATRTEEAEACLTDILIEADTKGVKVGSVTGALLIVKQTNLRFKPFAEMHRTLMDALHPGAQFFQAMYCESSLAEGLRLQLILTGINTLDEFVGPREYRPPI